MNIAWKPYRQIILKKLYLSDSKCNVSKFSIQLKKYNQVTVLKVATFICSKILKSKMFLNEVTVMYCKFHYLSKTVR